MTTLRFLAVAWLAAFALAAAGCGSSNHSPARRGPSAISVAAVERVFQAHHFRLWNAGCARIQTNNSLKKPTYPQAPGITCQLMGPMGGLVIKNHRALSLGWRVSAEVAATPRLLSELLANRFTRGQMLANGGLENIRVENVLVLLGPGGASGRYTSRAIRERVRATADALRRVAAVR